MGRALPAVPIDAAVAIATIVANKSMVRVCGMNGFSKNMLRANKTLSGEHYNCAGALGRQQQSNDGAS
jgi:hypothetical protein